MYRCLGYDPIGDFTPLGLIIDAPMTLVARRDFPAVSMTELVQVIRRARDRLKYVNAGVGSGSHLCGFLLQSALDAPRITVFYRGTGPAMNDLVAGTVDLLCDQNSNAIEQIRGGTIRAFAAITSSASPPCPICRPPAEGGLPASTLTSTHTGDYEITGGTCATQLFALGNACIIKVTFSADTTPSERTAILSADGAERTLTGSTTGWAAFVLVPTTPFQEVEISTFSDFVCTGGYDNIVCTL